MAVDSHETRHSPGGPPLAESEVVSIYAPPLRTTVGPPGYTVASGAGLHDQLGVAEHRALYDQGDVALDPREVDTLPIEQRLRTFEGTAPAPILAAPSPRFTSDGALEASLCSAASKLQGCSEPELSGLRVALEELLQVRQVIAAARAGGRR
jgi:hypothetical protein